jgi:hypothetical protein
MVVQLAVDVAENASPLIDAVRAAAKISNLRMISPLIHAQSIGHDAM